MALELFERPIAKEIYMLAGWRQWADAGSVSSGLPHYLVETLGARKIGHIKPNGFYLFQTQVSQFLFRPHVRFENGYRTSIRKPTNEVYYWGNEDNSKGLVIFLGDEPHMNVDDYVEAFFSIAQQLRVKRAVSVGGIYASVPFDKDRHFSCSYSLRRMKDELSEYVVNFSNYEGGVSLGSYMNDRAEALNIEYFTLYAFVPMYDFSQLSQKSQNMSIENDYRAWHELLLRLNHMFGLRLDLTELSRDSARLTEQLHEHVADLSRQNPSFPINDYMTRIAENFEERSFTKLDDVWEDALRDMFDEE
ncbi:MAG: PAC2 family protein [Anaerolineae bacterium]|nr:PAC2 family protein [Anaerolineae bacterium]